MAKKTEKAKNQAGEKQNEPLWRKPISLDAFEEDDPFAALYGGNREITGEPAEKFLPVQRAGKSLSDKQTSQKKPAPREISEESGKKNHRQATSGIRPAEKKDLPDPKIGEDDLKRLLRIKSEIFEFSDIREILRGKSLEIYIFLRRLSDETNGVCKIRHQELMENLDISRPTLFKQSDWLVRLSLIEKKSVPGDHLGTTYTVRRAEDVLPVPGAIIGQLESFIADFQSKEGS